MKKPSNKAIAIYLTWALIHLGLLLSSPPENLNLQFYNLSGFAFYMIAPILIYYIITLLKTKDEADR
jgi:hypothetical protein